MVIEKQKRRRGPQPLDVTEKKHNRVNVYFSDDELFDLKRRAGDVKPTQFLREFGLTGAVNRPGIPQVNLDALKELSRIGSNLNQIARELHTLKSFDSTVLRELVAELNVLRTQLISVPGGVLAS